MSFIWEQLQQFGMVAIIIICAIGGTVGMLKLIKCFAPEKVSPKTQLLKNWKKIINI